MLMDFSTIHLHLLSSFVALSYDFGGWMPNNPFSLQQAPPTTKGGSDESTILKTLPDVNITVQGMSTSWVLSRRSADYVPLRVYPEERFSEAVPWRLIESIRKNSKLKLPYPCLCPEDVENSVAI
ncbi:hypothetical protein MATL_G00166240 [Megalops atlanticus]|uniref:Lipoxygenase domain-containing protein n=1 Tax=Megalops atlanticus TaxID=7932 RepID=A0A9D3T0Z4_MEGAT|nr:hypothetical protein MATL_G00166240 [Megalops atlanticus]